jgi:hypothetical protein
MMTMDTTTIMFNLSAVAVILFAIIALIIMLSSMESFEIIPIPILLIPIAMICIVGIILWTFRKGNLEDKAQERI